MHIRPNLILTFILSPRPLQGNVEIETYWLKGKRDKDGNAQAACPQFETHTISKVDISSPEAKGDKEAVVRDPPSRPWMVYTLMCFIAAVIITISYVIPRILAPRVPQWRQGRTRMM